MHAAFQVKNTRKQAGVQGVPRLNQVHNEQGASAPVRCTMNRVPQLQSGAQWTVPQLQSGAQWTGCLSSSQLTMNKVEKLHLYDNAEQHENFDQKSAANLGSVIKNTLDKQTDFDTHWTGYFLSTVCFLFIPQNLQGFRSFLIFYFLPLAWTAAHIKVELSAGHLKFPEWASQTGAVGEKIKTHLINQGVAHNRIVTINDVQNSRVGAVPHTLNHPTHSHTIQSITLNHPIHNHTIQSITQSNQ